MAEERPCCVFNKPTKLCCPRCRTAGVDIHFCSKEHQKLVCGERSNPFYPPDYSPAEAAFLASIVRKPLIPQCQSNSHLAKMFETVNGRYTLAKSIELDAHLPGKFEELILVLVGRAICDPPESKPDMLQMVRQRTYIAILQILPVPPYDQLNVFHLVTLAHTFIQGVDPSLSTEWVNAWTHQALITFQVALLAGRGKKPGVTVPPELVQHAQLRLCSMLIGTVKFTLNLALRVTGGALQTPGLAATYEEASGRITKVSLPNVVLL
ncbi:hypothetical protein JCM10450v2_003559 [Rhodotorula kratochvilovae]